MPQAHCPALKLNKALIGGARAAGSLELAQTTAFPQNTGRAKALTDSVFPGAPPRLARCSQKEPGRHSRDSHRSDRVI
jgi:hypothetical protein